MKQVEDFVMFIPACGWGERVAERGIKPFIKIFDNKIDKQSMALNRVLEQAPIGMDIEVAVRQEMGCPPLCREATVYFIKPTSGQAQTIYQWLRRTRLRNYILLSNCDNVIDPQSIAEGIRLLDNQKRKGIVFTFRPNMEGDSRWSYVDRDNVTGRVDRIVEKQAISQDAVAGVYILNAFTLRMSIYPGDVYLSEALSRMPGLYAYRVKHYEGWNDLQQLEELEKGEQQSL